MSNTMKLDNLRNLLQSEHADYSIHTHDFTIESAAMGAKHYGISLSETTPTLILKTNDGYMAAIICGNTRISFKKLKQALDVKDIRLADPKTVFELTGAKVGEVSLINPDLPTLIDKHVLQNQYCYGGSGVPKTTLKIKTQDLMRITNAQVLDFTKMH